MSSMNRILKLIAIDCQNNRRLIINSAIALFIIMLPFSMSTGNKIYFFLLYTIGFYLSSFAFEDVHNRNMGYQYMTLPSSHFEKFMAKVLQTTVLLSVSLLLLSFLAKVVVHLLLFILVLFLQPEPHYFSLLFHFDFFNLSLLFGLMNYFTISSIIFVGSIYFKRYTLIKTALCFGIALSLYLSLIAFLTWASCPRCEFIDQEQYFRVFLTIGNASFWNLLAPACLYITYRKLTRVELAA